METYYAVEIQKGRYYLETLSEEKNCFRCNKHKKVYFILLDGIKLKEWGGSHPWCPACMKKHYQSCIKIQEKTFGEVIEKFKLFCVAGGI